MSAPALDASAVLPGMRFPLGATVLADGVNFAVSSGVADGMLLCLFDDAGRRDPGRPARVRRRGLARLRRGRGAGQAYGYRATGP